MSACQWLGNHHHVDINYTLGNRWDSLERACKRKIQEKLSQKPKIYIYIYIKPRETNGP